MDLYEFLWTKQSALVFASRIEVLEVHPVLHHLDSADQAVVKSKDLLREGVESYCAQPTTAKPQVVGQHKFM